MAPDGKRNRAFARGAGQIRHQQLFAAQGHLGRPQRQRDEAEQDRPVNGQEDSRPPGD